MNVLLINTPPRLGKDGARLPIDLLYVGSTIQRCGYNARIFDLSIDSEAKTPGEDNFSSLFRVIEEYQPAIIIYGGFAFSYGNAKRVSRQIKKKYPDIFQVAQGELSSTYKLLFTNTDIDLVFHGETEISLPMFLAKFVEGNSYEDLPGISYDNKRELIRHPAAPQVKDLDTIPFPAYDLIDIKLYMGDIDEWLGRWKNSMEKDFYFADCVKRIGTKKNYIPIISGRGCTGSCLFCYRHLKGIRKHSVNYVINHMKYLMDNYGIEGFHFVDELFNPTLDWVNDFCNALEKANLDIVYFISGARVDRINADLLRRLKETGCLEICYGQESGSDTILKELCKGVNSQLNKEVTITTKELGLVSPVMLVIGSPSENTGTIHETIQFLKDAGKYDVSLNYLTPLPETPIWKYVEENHLVKDLESYLDQVAEYGRTEPLVNLTKCQDREWRKWLVLIRKEIRLGYYKNDSVIYYYYNKLLYNLLYLLLSFIPKATLKKKVPGGIQKIIGKLP